MHTTSTVKPGAIVVCLYFPWMPQHGRREGSYIPWTARTVFMAFHAMLQRSSVNLL